ncbi:MAG: cytochrome c oxidase assembly protein [Gammaproteobacteria bacterium]
MAQTKITKTVTRLTLVVVVMFGFGYVLVPLYEAYCDLTGRGKVVGISETEARDITRDDERLVTVVFDTNVRDIPWEFKPVNRQLRVHPGKMSEAVFIVRNESDRPVVGRAIPSVSPAQAGIYFNKTECFCFSEQLLQAGESKEVLVRFIVDTDLPKRFSSLTLSYTFFDITDQAKVAQKQSGAKDNTSS